MITMITDIIHKNLRLFIYSTLALIILLFIYYYFTNHNSDVTLSLEEYRELWEKIGLPSEYLMVDRPDQKIQTIIFSLDYSRYGLSGVKWTTRNKFLYSKSTLPNILIESVPDKDSEYIFSARIYINTETFNPRQIENKVHIAKESICINTETAKERNSYWAMNVHYESFAISSNQPTLTIRILVNGHQDKIIPESHEILLMIRDIMNNLHKCFLNGGECSNL